LVRPFLPLAPEAGLTALTTTSALSGLGLLLLVGLAAGLFPAYQASRLHPAEALRARDTIAVTYP
jgi:ABC-type antimicrobial peptide transport system permease subunit